MRAKAAVNAPHSTRFARFYNVRRSRQRLECGDFSTAFVRPKVHTGLIAVRPSESAVAAALCRALPLCRFAGAVQDGSTWFVNVRRLCGHRLNCHAVALVSPFAWPIIPPIV